MRLKRLEIVGFKSFADPFKIDFKQGISAVVGPNGCGKSNVADAIRWVLGNQSPKQLRADRMESVIFSGSTKRKQLGMAEVILTFDNADRVLSLDYDEVSVSRKLFRTGDSEYSINGSRCRLMDITDLVVDKGLGATGYWILESKMVGTILSSRPEDRRFLFDEAAGIVKYKIQRHRAELKLKSAAGDLERLSDIIVEVESTCNGLKKQVSAYKRHEKISETVGLIQLAMRFIEASKIKADLKNKTDQLEETGAIVGRETASLATQSAVLAEARLQFSRVQNGLDDTHRKCSDLDSKLAANDRESAVTSERIISAETKIAENNARMARERERVHRYASDLEELEDQQAQLFLSIKGFQNENEKAVKALELLEQKLKLIREKKNQTKSIRLEFDAQLDQLRHSFREQIRQEEARLHKLTSLKELIESLTEKKTVTNNSISGFSEDCTVLTEKLKSIEDSLHREKHSLIDFQDKISLVNGELSESGQSIAVLQERVRQINSLLQESSTSNGLSSLIKPFSGMGKAIGAYLDSFDSAGFIHSIDHNTKGDGRRYLLPVSICSVKMPEKAVSLVDCVEKNDKFHFISDLLSYGVLAPDRATAISWISSGFSRPVVTIQGDVFRPDGLVKLGVSESSAGSLELNDILEALEKQLKKSLQIKRDLLLSRDDHNGKVSIIKETIKEISENQRKIEGKLVGSQTSLKNAEREFSLINIQIDTCNMDLIKIEENKAISSGLDIENSITVLEDKRADAIHIEEKLIIELSTMESQIVDARRQSDNLGFNLRDSLNRQKEVKSRIELLGNESDNLFDLIEELQRENEKSGAGIISLRNRTDILVKENHVLKSRRATEEEQRVNYSKQRNVLMESSAVLEREVQKIREKLGKAKTSMIELESQTTYLLDKLKSFEEKDSIKDNPYMGKLPEELILELNRKSLTLEKIGPVNMLAVSEFEETSQRLTYLVTQRDDLDQAQASLVKAITEINTEAAERFKETFDKVRTHFQNMFVKLFGGGEGDIISIEGNDPLEGGIEILARPKGKKLKNVIALSAGERALTAVALLFSLYLVKPSPFCVLDELDGPFDDSNTDKFISILREFSVNTQFIVITHNKRTMEGADVLYGITMAEDGVSTITSVNLEEMV